MSGTAAALAGGKRDRFTRLPILETAAPGATLTLDFTGTAVGAYLLAGPDAGMVEVSIDGGPPATRDLWHEFSAGLHYPRTVLFADSLAPGRHRLTLRVLAQHNPRSTGTAARLMHFVVNDPPPDPRPDEGPAVARTSHAMRDNGAAGSAFPLLRNPPV